MSAVGRVQTSCSARSLRPRLMKIARPAQLHDGGGDGEHSIAARISGPFARQIRNAADISTGSVA